MNLPFPDKADELLAVLVDEYQPANLVALVKAGDHHGAVVLAGQIDLVNALIEWRTDTLNPQIEGADDADA